MGSGPSKPSTAPATQVWSSETPVRFSQDLVNSLQSSPETDSTRAKAFELQVQARVAAELKRLEESTNAKLAEIEAKISSQPAESTPAPEQQTDAQAAGDALRQLGRESVQKEVEELRKKLESRKKVNALSEEVEKAKSEVIRCLRDNDRRPLNCWDEVQRFKVEVRRLEENWVDKIIQ